MDHQSFIRSPGRPACRSTGDNLVEAAKPASQECPLAGQELTRL
jgi:hypothetical protein